MNAEEWIRSLRDAGNEPGGSPWRPGGGRVRSGEVLADSAVQGFDALRSSASLAERQVVLSAGAHTVALEFAPVTDDETSDELEVGTVLRVARGRVDGPGVVTVQVVAPTGVEMALVVPDEFGEFEFEIPTGRWTLVVSDDDHDVEVDLDVA